MLSSKFGFGCLPILEFYEISARIYECIKHIPGLTEKGAPYFSIYIRNQDTFTNIRLGIENICKEQRTQSSDHF